MMRAFQCGDSDMKLIVIGLLLACCANVAGAATLYSNYGNSIWEIDISDGSATAIYNQSSSALVYGDGLLYSVFAGDTWSIDPSSGVSSLVSDLGGGKPLVS